MLDANGNPIEADLSGKKEETKGSYFGSFKIDTSPEGLASKVLSVEQRAYVVKVKRFATVPLEASIDEVEPYVPPNKKKEFEQLKDIALNPDKYKNDKRAEAFKRDPAVAFLNEAEKLVPKPEDKQKIEVAKILVDKSKQFDQKLEALLPPEQKPKFEKFLKVYRQANEKY